MAWQAYMESSLLGTGAVDQVIVFEKHGDLTLASSMGFLVTNTELRGIRHIFQCGGSGEISQAARDQGFQVAGQTYFAVKADSRSLYGTNGDEGVCIVNTKTATLVAHFSSPSCLEEAARCVEQLCDYLIERGT